jgi:hypothetical protein
MELSSTDYTKTKLATYDKIIIDGEGLDDLKRVKEFGIDSKYVLDYLLWMIFKHWIEKNPLDGKTIRDLSKDILYWVSTNPIPCSYIYDITSIHHHVNGYRFVGFLRLKKDASGKKEYFIEDNVRQKGMKWFRLNNIYMKGLFQSERGLFDLV